MTRQQDENRQLVQETQPLAAVSKTLPTRYSGITTPILTRATSAPIRRSLLCNDRIYAMIDRVAEIEAHDEVVEWFDDLSQDEWERTQIVVDRLASLGSRARMPFSRSLGDGVFEVRFSLGSTARRITYRFAKDGRIILLTTFRKQRNNERAEVSRARKIAQDCAKRNP